MLLVSRFILEMEQIMNIFLPIATSSTNQVCRKPRQITYCLRYGRHTATIHMSETVTHTISIKNIGAMRVLVHFTFCQLL